MTPAPTHPPTPPRRLRPLRIAVLVCDTTTPAVLSAAAASNDADGAATPGSLPASMSGYGALFRGLLESAAARAGDAGAVEVVEYDAWAGKVPEEAGSGFDAVVHDRETSAYEDHLEWVRRLKAFVRAAAEARATRVVGVCFGHQIVAEALGGKVSKNPKGWEVGWTEMAYTPEGRALFGGAPLAANADSSAYPDRPRLLSMHQDHVEVVPPGFAVTMSSPVCAVQGMVRGSDILTVQAHPEFNRGLVRELVRSRTEDVKIFSPEFAATVYKHLDDPAAYALDSAWFADVMYRFIAAGASE
ncbi:class I glutamine amidotransferase-like protein [Zopfochytrium polystomum]|nr:class I glutamine amidotransferase-like protein [Zopfochytrium polystomum]